MRKKYIIIILILMVIGLIITIINSKTMYTEIEGIKYAILVNGEPSNSFPTGDYSVDVDCSNADAYWNSISNKIIVKNIKGDVTCSVEFNSVANSDYLNSYIINLSNTTQGNGTVIHEVIHDTSYNTSSVVTTYGTQPVFFQNTSSTAITQTSIDDYWTFSNGTFTSDPSKFVISGTNFYHAYIKVPENGTYRICYTIAKSTNTGNRLLISKNTINFSNIESSTYKQIGENCYDMGYLGENDYINIAERAYSGTSSPVISFRIETDSNPLPVDTGYRYEGKNPNNYIVYNNELWRIIGVFSTEYDSNNNGTANETANLVKIIRNDSIGGFIMDKSERNEWPNTDLYHLLNYQYYDWETNSVDASDYCFGDYISTQLHVKCDFSRIGIKNGYRNMIEKVKWYMGGPGKVGYEAGTPDNVYGYERNSHAVNSGASFTLGYVGLMNTSDYLYGVLASDCARTTIQGLYNVVEGTYRNVNCTVRNWLYSQDTEWTITKYSNSDVHVWSPGWPGSINTSQTNMANSVRPVLYLSPDVYRVSGTGTITDPYIIGMATS